MLPFHTASGNLSGYTNDAENVFKLTKVAWLEASGKKRGGDWSALGKFWLLARSELSASLRLSFLYAYSSMP
jgi:cob(I)alamin adenosyltransferase